MLVPSDSPDVELKEEENYPPGDARAMSPRRSPEETNKMFDKSRAALTKYVYPYLLPSPYLSLPLSDIIATVEQARRQARKKATDWTCSHAMEVQSSLDALVNRCENVQSDLSKLEKNNNDLQEYIGGLTRSMSKSTDLSSTGRKK